MATEDRQIPVVAYTARHRIEGTILLLKGERLSDKLNEADREFEAVSHAKVYAAESGELLHEAAHVALNKTHLSLLVPAEAD